MIPAVRYQPRGWPSDQQTRSTISPTTPRSNRLYTAPGCTLHEGAQVCVDDAPVPVAAEPRAHPGGAGEIPATGFGGALVVVAAAVLLAGLVVWLSGRWSR